MSETHHLGQRLSYDGALCTVRYIGEVAGTSGTWLGVEWDDATRGRHDGHHKNVRYFKCISKAPTAASFVRPARTADTPQSFIAALQHKYASEAAAQQQNPYRNADVEFVFFGKKVAEEVGFDKIRRQLARLDELKIVILDGMRIAWDVSPSDGEKGIKETSPLVSELDLSRNLFESFGTVVQICRELPELRSLRLNGNRFQRLQDDQISSDFKDAFLGVKDLELEGTLLSWEGVRQIATYFPSLAVLNSSFNQLAALPPTDLGSLTTTLTTLTLEFNDFTSLSDLSALTSLSSLRSLHLKGNSISSICPSSDVSPPVFSASLMYLDVSYNAISTWSFVDALTISVPGLTALRIAHNPIYDNPDIDSEVGTNSTSAGLSQAKGSEEAHMVTIARIPALKSLNFGPITVQDRTNAELFYLSRIAKQLSSVPESEEGTVIARHPQYAALCENHGEPVVVRRDEINPAFLDARLVKIRLRLAGGGGGGGDGGRDDAETKVMEIPRSFDMYTVQGIAGKLFGLPPLSVRLVWETGEWDPVGGFDEEVDSSDGEGSDSGEALEGSAMETPAAPSSRGEESLEQVEQAESNKTGRWVKREVALVEGPRQLGFCVDGAEATIRVEVR